MSNSYITLRFAGGEAPREVKVSAQEEDAYTFQLNGLTDNHNLYQIFNRKKGEIFRVDDERKLTVVKGLKGRVKYCFKRSTHQEKVQQVVHATLKKLNETLQQENNRKVCRVAFQHFMSGGTLSRMSRHVFDPTILAQYKVLSQLLLADDLDLMDAKANYNLWKLLHRKKREKFGFNKDDVLVKRHFSYSPAQTVQRNTFKEIVTNTITKLNKHTPKEEATKRDVRQLFTDNLSHLPRALFYRGAIEEDGDLEKLLMPELAEKRETLKTELGALQGDADKRLEMERAFMDLTYQEFLFAQSLGFDLERIYGGTGAPRKAYDRFHRVIFVVKAGDEGPFGVNNPSKWHRIKRWFVNQKSCLRGNNESLAEEDSYVTDREFKIHVVPPTDLRDVTSKNFFGKKKTKESSVQMWVEGAVSLGAHLGLTYFSNNLPRWFLRHYLSRTYQEGTLKPALEKKLGKKVGTWLYNRIKTSDAVLDKVDALPEELLERLGLHNFLVEDIDCHFENIMYKEKSGTSSVARSVMRQETTEGIDGFVNTLFKDAQNQVLLEELFHSQDEKILIKHDGGATNPHDHPVGYRGTRFKHLFEVLPQFKKNSFTQATDLMNGVTNETFFINLELITMRALRNALGREILDTFVADDENLNLLRQWIYTSLRVPLGEIAKRDEVIAKLTACLDENLEESEINEKKVYFLYHLNRIKQVIEARKDCWAVTQKHLKEKSDKEKSGLPMRTLFQIRTKKQFQHELAQPSTALDAFKVAVQGQKATVVKQIQRSVFNQEAVDEDAVPKAMRDRKLALLLRQP